ncbi:hypothetical protein, partial [Pseudomonas pergaminensis]
VKTVGAGFPAMAVCQLMACLLIHRYRRQASSHICRRCILESAAIDCPAQRHQPFHQLLRINRFHFFHGSIPRISDPSTIAVTRQTRESGGYLFG